MTNLDEDIKRLKAKSKMLEGLVVVTAIAMVSAFLLRYQTWGSILILVVCIMYVIKARVKKQLKQKELLAKEVEVRTQEIRSERDAVQEESVKLASALQALAEAQDELVRKERMATVGQLTKGLVDRILNPLNYINNFASLTSGLAKELRENLAENEASLPKDAYADSLELLEMMDSNLAKISDHGFNTVRIVKAMEELLKDRRGNPALANINSLCRIALEKLKKAYISEITQKHIRIDFQPLTLSLMLEVNAEQLTNVILGVLKNAMYAILKKAEKETFEPEIQFHLHMDSEKLQIMIRDNGTGIDEQSKEKIFAPFFTTKPTGEAAGIGLYLCREVVQNHRGTIDVNSEKGQFTEFLITLPVYQSKTESQRKVEEE